MDQTNNLTQEELLHLAVEATRRGEHGASISYLKEGVSRFPNDAKLAYVLGAEFAQIGMHDKAESEMQRAISIDSELYTASFQLGLLQLTLGKVDEAKSTWENINKLPKEHALWQFKTALEHLAAGENVEAKTLLESGIVSNDFSLELNNDMQMVLDSISGEDVKPEQIDADSITSQARLNAYTNTSSD